MKLGKRLAELKRNKVFELLGAVPTNPRWSWCAVSPDHKLAVFTLWADEMIGGRNRLLWDHNHSSSRNGEADQKRVLDLVIENEIPAYGLICFARDPSATPRSIKSVRRDILMRLKIVKELNEVWGLHEGEILMAELVKNISRFKQLHSNGLVDLGNPPEGVNAPDRALSTGYTVARNDRVRAYVIQRANGRCEHCGAQGFLLSNGQRYLEAHHILTLSHHGSDTVDNVIALCPEHHRQAHYGVDAESLEAEFIETVRKKQHQLAEQHVDHNLSRREVNPS